MSANSLGCMVGKKGTHDETDDDGYGNRDLEVLSVHFLESILPWTSLTCCIVAVTAITAW